MTRSSVGSVKCISVAAIAMVLAACGGGQEESAASSVPLAAMTLTASDIAVAREMELVDGVAMSGSLEPAQTVIVKAQVGGRLGTIRVDRGSRVTAGQVLVEIEAEGVKGQAASARALVTSAEASFALAVQRLESARRLQAAGAISDIDLRATEAAHEAASAQVAATKAQLAAAGEAESRTRVTAPLAGVVSDRSIESGEAVKDGDRLFTIVDIAALELDAQVGVDEAMRVRVGSPVTFSLDALPGQSLQGRVVRIDPRADPGTRQVGVAAHLANPGGRIVAGQYARGRILTGQSVTAVAIPMAAVSDSAGQARVYVIDGTTLSLRHVTLGTRDDAQGLVAVLEGLAVNDRILARPVVGAANGLTVTIASDSALSQPTPDGSK